MVDTKNKLSDTVIKWEFETQPIHGEINLFQILNNELNFKFFSTFEFVINTFVNDSEGYITVNYAVKNKTAKSGAGTGFVSCK
jgi:hypothetical protein